MPRINADLRSVTEDDMNYDGGGWLALEPGDYRFQVIESGYKQNSKRTGMTLSLKVQCVEPQHANSKWTEFLAIENPSPEAVRIARAKLKAIAIATGHPTPDYVERSEDLHNITFLGNVGVEQSDDPKYGDRNGLRNRLHGAKPLPGTQQRPAYRKPDHATAAAGDDINPGMIPF